MRFWLKISLLSLVGYLACYTAMFVQDRREQHAVVGDVEAITRRIATSDMSGDNQAEAREELIEAKVRLDHAEERWQRDASRLMLLSVAK